MKLSPNAHGLYVGAMVGMPPIVFAMSFIKLAILGIGGIVGMFGIAN